MGGKTEISWTRHPETGKAGSTWNPVRGCSIKSEGCLNCYAMHMAARYSGVYPNGKKMPYYGLARFRNRKAQWTGKLSFAETHLHDPVKWGSTPRLIFVNSMSDLFHERMPVEWINQVMQVMLDAPMHTYQILTKRPDVMQKYLSSWIHTAMWPSDRRPVHTLHPMRRVDVAPPHLWCGASVENQETASRRIRSVMETPAYVRWLSVEPMIGPITIKPWVEDGKAPVEWVVIGGESAQGGRVRPMELRWMVDLITECKDLGIRVFVKQMGKVLARTMHLKSPAGKNPLEWPEGLQLPQEYPKTPEQIVKEEPQIS